MPIPFYGGKNRWFFPARSGDMCSASMRSVLLWKTTVVDSRVPSMGAVRAIHEELAAWLQAQALPFWDEHGVDRGSGGFFEEIIHDVKTRRCEGIGRVRRGRVVARQIYVFDVGRRLGWTSSRSSPVQHGCGYLFSRLHQGSGSFLTAVDHATNESRAPFNLYEYAFYLFALARVDSNSAEHFPVAQTAASCLDQLRRGWAKSNGGFEETDPPSLPLKSNPHMHLLEAALAWIEVTDGSSQRPWIGLAREIVGLCLNHFMERDTGAIREYFDFDWRPAAGEAGRIVEPGHQFEWAWLLLLWASSSHSTSAERSACRDAAEKLVAIGERWGVDPVREVAINEIWDDMTVKDPAAKLWPQTERLKAWCAMLQYASGAAAAEFAARKIIAAAHGLSKYLLREPVGLWHEVLSADGTFASGPSKASSFYHIVCAIDVLRQTVAACHPDVLYSRALSATV